MAAVAGAYSIDAKIHNSVLDHGNRFQDEFVHMGYRWTEFDWSAPLMAGLISVGWYADRPELKRAGVNMLQTTAFALLATDTLKRVFLRCRPNHRNKRSEWFKNGCGRAFPSGHATLSFSLSASLAKSFPDSHWWLPVTAYTLAVAGSYGRLYDNKHWLSDVVAGAAIGYYTAEFVVKRRKNIKNQSVDVVVVPRRAWAGAGEQPRLNVGLRWSW